MKMVNLQQGLSGCRLQLIDGHKIRKSSSDKNYDQRLMQQINKQKLFSKINFKNIRAPIIFDTNFENAGGHYFDMEYVTGHSFDLFFSHCSVESINFVLEVLLNYINTLAKNTKNYSDNAFKKRIWSKIDSLMAKSKYPDFLNYIRGVEMSGIPNTFCHGDLTFSNIIFDSEELYFIDFLDSFVDSFLCDLVKLKQDLYYHWNLHIQKVDNLRIRQIFNYLWKHLESRYHHYIHSNAFMILDALNLLRIEPYLTDAYQKNSLNSLLKRLPLYEDFNRSHGRKINTFSAA